MSTALILIDIQNDYFPGGRMELSGSDIAASRAALLLKTFRLAGWPVFHVQHVSTRPGAGFFLPDTPGVQIHPSVTPLAGEAVITKNFPNSFRDTDLLERLHSGKVGSLLICGMMTSMCVDATVRAAFDYGFTCTVVSDACATKDLTLNNITVSASQVHISFLAALGAVYADIKDADDILDTITSS